VRPSRQAPHDRKVPWSTLVTNGPIRFGQPARPATTFVYAGFNQFTGYH
jgi:hypothetical protein